MMAGGDGVAVSGAAEARTYGGRTAWARNLGAPVRDFLSTQTGGAAVMALATVAALVWANSPWLHSYESVWSTTLAVRIGGAGITADLRVWVNEGLMTVFFLVVGLEAKREFDLGELRDRRRVVIPVLAAIGGIAVPVAIYIGVNAGGPGAHRSSTTESVNRNTRSRVAERGVSRASAPSANALSVDIAAPHPCAPGPPALTPM